MIFEHDTLVTNVRYQNLALILLLLLLGACASNAGVWVKDHSAPLQVDQDKYVCLQESQQPYGYDNSAFGRGPYGWGGYGGYSGNRTNQELYSACMKAKGYHWEAETTLHDY